MTKGVAWAAPAVAIGASAPAMAASGPTNPTPVCVTRIYPSLRSGAVTEVVQVGNVPVTVVITPDTSGTVQTSQTSTFNMGSGKTAYGSAYAQNYQINTTNGTNDLILNQKSPSTESVTVAFFDQNSNPIDVSVSSVPIDDLSTARKYVGNVFTGYNVDPTGSYQDVVKLIGTSAAGATVAATPGTVTRTYDAGTTAADLRGNLTDGIYFDVNLTNRNNNGVGGTLNTSFAQPIHQYTVTYSANAQSGTSNFTATQGLGLGAYTFCV